jgi:hypothetical protein
MLSHATALILAHSLHLVARRLGVASAGRLAAIPRLLLGADAAVGWRARRPPTYSRERRAASIILLRYAESSGEMLRSLVLLKMRGSQHDSAIRRYTIDGSGMHIGESFQHVAGILSGNPTWQRLRVLARASSPEPRPRTVVRPLAGTTPGSACR